MMKTLFLLSISFFLIGCNSSSNQETDKIAGLFFDVYANRADFNRMQSFYADKIEYENIILDSKFEVADPAYIINDIFNWNDPKMQFPSERILEVEQLITTDSTVVATGYFMPYTYNGNQIDGMKFVTWLTLDKNKKIKKQVDWFQYPIEDIIDAHQIKTSIRLGQ